MTGPDARQPSRHRRASRTGGGLVVLVLVLVLTVAELGVRTIEPDLPAPASWGNPFADLKTEQLTERAAPGRGPTEVVLVGSSVVNAGLDPTRLASAAGEPDLAVYNAALPSFPPEQWPSWIVEVVQPTLGPSVVVLGVSIRDLNGTTADLVHESRFRDSVGFRRATGRAGGLERLDATVSERSALVRHRAALRRPGSVVARTRGEEVEGWPRLEVDADGRYLGFDDDDSHRPRPDRLDGLRDGILRDFRAGGLRLDAVARVVDGLRDAGVEVALLRMPAMNDVLVDGEVVPRAEAARFDELLRDLAADRGLAFVDASELDDRPELFSDEYHLRARGVAELSDLVGRQLGPFLTR
jgi:hypothetical protein